MISTGQGLLGNNMYAYCRNNPVCRIDITGYADMDAFDGEVDIGPNEKEIGGGGASSGQPPVGAGTTGSSSSYSSSSSYVAFDPTQAILDGTMVPSAWCNEKSNIPQDARDMLDYLRDHNFTSPKKA